MQLCVLATHELPQPNREPPFGVQLLSAIRKIWICVQATQLSALHSVDELCRTISSNVVDFGRNSLHYRAMKSY